MGLERLGGKWLIPFGDQETFLFIVNVKNGIYLKWKFTVTFWKSLLLHLI